MTRLTRLLFVFLSAALSTLHVSALPADTTYRVEANLRDIENDQVQITLYPPTLTGDTAVYNMPKMVPGTYAISDFGRFVSGLEAFDRRGGALQVIRLDTNRWAITPAENLDHITYRVDDTFDAPNSGIFPPGGTNIEAGKNVVFNAFGFVGYFQGAKNRPFDLRITKPETFYGETTLPRVSSSPDVDRFSAEDYFQLHDCPILYCAPDTTSMQVGPTRVSVAVYSPTGKVTAAEVMDAIGELFPATAKYLGGVLPTDQYAVLIYFASDLSMMRGMGALEHNTSTLAVMPEWNISAQAQTLKDVVAHEFFHIVTPLNIHSREVDDFDFIHPEMSAHLWLYEGTTEYAAHHMQVVEGLTTMDDFLHSMKQKIASAKRYNDTLPFTELSKGALDKYAHQYLNVYQKGALIGMALDLELLHLSEGSYGLLDLKEDLMKLYGPNKPFDDDSLFAVMARVSGQPEAAGFLRTYVAGSKPLPLSTLLGYVGIEYAEEKTDTIISAGHLGIGYNPRTEHMIVASVKDANAFGKAMGFAYGDEIVAWNGTEVNQDNFRDVIASYRQRTNPGDEVNVEILRKNEEGEPEKLVLTAPAITETVVLHDVLEPVANPTKEQLALRKAWINQ